MVSKPKLKTPKTFRILIKTKRGLFSLSVLILYALIATVGVELLPANALDKNPLNPYQPPSLKYPLGTDFLGRDIFAQIVHGSRITLMISFLGALFTVLIGTAAGLVAGYVGGKLEESIMLATDIVLTIPGVVLFVLLATFFRRTDALTFAFLLSITAWAGLARAIRSQTLSIKGREFIEAAKTLGLSRFYIIFQEILPNVAPYMVINFLFSLIYCVYATVGLFFIGLTVSGLGVTNWGMMMNQALLRGFLIVSTPMALMSLFAPIVTILILTISLVFLAGIQEIFNPRIREEA